MQSASECDAFCAADPVWGERELDGKSDAPGDAVHRQHARQRGATRVWRNSIADELDRWIGLYIEEVGTAQVIVAKVHVGIDALRLNHCGDRGALRMFLVVDDCRLVIVEATADRYGAKQCRGKTNCGMHAVYGIAGSR